MTVPADNQHHALYKTHVTNYGRTSSYPTSASNRFPFGNSSSTTIPGNVTLSISTESPGAHVDNSVILYAKDTTDATSTLALYTEQAVEALGTFTATNKLKIFINGTAYWIQLDSV
jgi:hypothetical protein